MQRGFTRDFNTMMKRQEVRHFGSKESMNLYLTDSLTGILKGNCDLNQVRGERLKEKYEIIN